MEALAEPRWPPGLAMMKVSVSGRPGRGRRGCERGGAGRAPPPRPYPARPRDAGPQFPTPETDRERTAAVRGEPRMAALTNRMFWGSVTTASSPGYSHCNTVSTMVTVHPPRTSLCSQRHHECLGGRYIG